MTICTLYASEADDLIGLHDVTTPDLTLPMDIRAQAIIALLRNIEPDAEGARRLWMAAKRGPIDAFDPWRATACHGDGAAPPAASDWRERCWRELYPEEEQWYEIAVGPLGHPIAPTVDLTVNNGFTIRFSQEVSASPPSHSAVGPHPNGRTGIAALHEQELMAWLIDGLEDCVRQCTQGTYNATIRERLPYSMRYGLVSRERYWQLYPQTKTLLFDHMCAEEAYRFAILFHTDGTGRSNAVPSRRLRDMNATAYLDACMIAYQAMGLAPPQSGADGGGWFAQYADPRCLELLSLDQSSNQDFAAYVAACSMSLTAWGIRLGPGFAWLRLIPAADEHGWYLRLAWSSLPSAIEAVRAALALHDAGMPIAVDDAAALAAMLTGDDLIGIMPYHQLIDAGALAAFRRMHGVGECIALPMERRSEIVEAARWLPIKEVRLNR
ncbi:hypothetical protein [Bifidobacterium jacchi]|uniref:Uncharacterized protein n=1 Tax=Bifidobacterium jacchi TaxID=2490545 RepID=A0A5N5RLU3_9BIFI|nr:hypothetical protein [Bifidobacterium jacchi]KAB5608316.1 hypothetical protein EHS19_01415 [Bifidobacterium jacchi]